MIYIPAVHIMMAKTANNNRGGLIIHKPREAGTKDEWFVTCCYGNAVRLWSGTDMIVAFGSDYGDETFAPGYGAITPTLARAIADDLDDAEDGDIVAAFWHFLESDDPYTRSVHQNDDLAGMKDYLRSESEALA